jgi:hypothetical protein
VPSRCGRTLADIQLKTRLRYSRTTRRAIGVDVQRSSVSTRPDATSSFTSAT